MASELSDQKVKAAIRKIARSRSPGKRRSEENVLYTYRNTLAPQLTEGASNLQCRFCKPTRAPAIDLGVFDVACPTERHRHRPRGAVQPAARRVRELPPLAVPASVRRAEPRRGRRPPGLVNRWRRGRALGLGPYINATDQQSRTSTDSHCGYPPAGAGTVSDLRSTRSSASVASDNPTCARISP